MIPAPAREARDPLRIVFMGTPDFAAAVLRRVADWPGGQAIAAYCQPDRPAGRGRALQPPAVKSLALSLGIPVFQPLNFREDVARRELAALCPDVLVVAAYGLILPQSVLDIPRLGPFNVHASLLPRLRGAAPIQWAIMQGDSVTGITIMRMEAGLDAGPMLAQRALGIGLDDTADSLSRELADLGGRLMVEELERLAAGQPSPAIPQDAARATYAAKLSKADGRIRWNAPAHVVHAHLRGVTPWPGGQTTFLAPGRAPLPVLVSPGEADAIPPAGANPAGSPDARYDARPGERPEPGTILGLAEGRLVVACSDASYRIATLKPAGGRPMDAAAFWNGYCRNHADRLRFAEPSAPDGAVSR